jgi:hypothetical protein
MSRHLARTTRTDCPTCGDRVIWAITAKGKRQALNYEPDPAGNVAAAHEASGAWRARSSPPGEPLRAPEKRYMPHWATSPRCAPPKDAGGQRAAAGDVVSFLDQYRKARSANEAAKRNRRGRRKPAQTYLGFRRQP